MTLPIWTLMPHALFVLMVPILNIFLEKKKKVNRNDRLYSKTIVDFRVNGYDVISMIEYK